MTAALAPIDEDWAHLRSQVRRMLGSRLASGADAEDVVQEVLLRVLRSAGSLRDGARFDAWLSAMVRNATADQLRARQRHPVPASDTHGDVEAAPPAGDESDETARRQLAAVLRPFAERLPALYRDVIILSELEGVPHAEIARRLAISVSGVKSRVQRGREQLRKMLTDCCQIALDTRHAVVECVPKTGGDGGDCCSPNEAPVRIRPRTS
jgi:RNA polymerase sigma-70 factor (ECF subfamily)